MPDYRPSHLVECGRSGDPRFRYPIGQQSRWSDKAHHYCRHIEHLAGQYPGNSYLDFYLTSDNIEQRDPCPITLVNLTNGQSDAQYDVKTSTNVNDLLQQASDNDSHKLIILEDPTPEVIAELGSRWNIDPQFWADFLVGSFWFDSGTLRMGHRKDSAEFLDDSLLEQLWLLPTDARQQDHRCIRFVAHRALDKNNDDLENEYLPLDKTHRITYNTLDGPPNYANTVPEHCKFALWNNFRTQRGNSNLESPSNFVPYHGVIAVKRLGRKLENPSERHHYVFREFFRKPSLQEEVNMSERCFMADWQKRAQNAFKGNASLREIMSSHLKHRLSEKAFRTAAAYAPDHLLIDIYRLIGCFWVTEIESQHLYLSWIEKFYQREITEQKKEILFWDLFTCNKLSEKLNADVIELWSHRTESGCYSHFIKELSECCDSQRPNDTQLSTLPNSSIPTFKDLAKDLDFLQECVKRLEERIQKNVEFLHTIGDDFETSRSTSRNRLLLLTTIWASVITPISILTSILNLGTARYSGAPRVGDIGAFWRAIIPLAAGLILVVLFIFWWGEKVNCDARKKSSLNTSTEPLLSKEEEKELHRERANNPVKQGCRKGLHWIRQSYHRK